MCKVCQKRPEVPDERYGRCEACAKAGRVAYRFRLAPRGAELVVKAGELSPRALKQKWAAALEKHSQAPAAKTHLGLHEAEMIVAKDRLETVRVANDLAARADDVMTALRQAATRADAAW
jgi:hypothetical protein